VLTSLFSLLPRSKCTLCGTFSSSPHFEIPVIPGQTGVNAEMQVENHKTRSTGLIGQTFPSSVPGFTLKLKGENMP
jgi:hypothetical protein